MRPITFVWKLSYQNEQEYDVFNHPLVTRIEAYSDATKFGLLEYQRKTCNYTPEEFEKIMVARQGGVIVRGIRDNRYNEKTYWDDRRFPEDLYHAFVQHLRDEHEKYLQHRIQQKQRYGWTDEDYPEIEATPIPRPIYYDEETKGYKTEPWYTPAMSQYTVGPQPQPEEVAA